MRLWSIHPQYLDRAGLTAVWREGLLAKKVLAGKTKGYRNHPQLIRFRESFDPLANINRYLSVIYHEAVVRGYKFSAEKIKLAEKISPKIKVTDKQLAYEFRHLLKKLATRDPNRYWKLKNPKKGTDIVVNGLFRTIKGDIAKWEKIA